ncbi:hypothetical protein F926_03305 [Acinetobacter haemolyticus NIPH 261]|nr:hypothetical protein F926_03305 [Acinetobacter haemolyticus NIPH 261]
MSEYNPNHQNAADIPRVSLKLMCVDKNGGFRLGGF